MSKSMPTEPQTIGALKLSESRRKVCAASARVEAHNLLLGGSAPSELGKRLQHRRQTQASTQTGDGAKIRCRILT